MPAVAKEKATLSDLRSLLSDGDRDAADVLAAVGREVISQAWGAGEIEFGRTRHVVAGNPALHELTHNGVVQAKSAVIVEQGFEWSGPKQRWHGPAAAILSETLPAAPTYQKYQLEVCVNVEKDVWEWLPEGADPGMRETRYARRQITRAEAEKLFTLKVRLTDRGLAALGGV